MDDNDAQFKNALSPIEVTLLGIVIDANELLSAIKNNKNISNQGME